MDDETASCADSQSIGPSLLVHSPGRSVVKMHKNYQTKCSPLTLRQLQVIELINAGRSKKQIASKYNISENTVKVHANAAYRVLGIRSRLSLQAYFDQISDDVAASKLPSS